MRKIISAFRVSVDGFIKGPNEEVDWVESWDDAFNLTPQVDACILGGGMYPEYEQYWTAILADPKSVFGGVATKNEVNYARWADKTPHIVLSKTLKKVEWKTSRIVRDVNAIREMKRQPGKDIYLIGGPTIVSSMINEGLVDELRLMVHPLILGGGKTLFKDVTERHALKLVQSRRLKSDKVILIYDT
jgi:dihydrofolate reductase